MRLVKFESANCPKCVAAQNFLDGNGVVAEKIDVNNHSDLDFISKHVNMSLPVIVLLDENDEVILRSESFNPPELEEIVAELNK